MVDLLLLRKFLQRSLNAFHIQPSSADVYWMNCGSFISFLFWGPSKIPPFFFSSLKPGKAADIYLKQLLSWSKSLTSCFIIPSLMCKGGKRVLFLSTSGSLIIFLSPQFRLLHSGGLWTVALYMGYRRLTLSLTIVKSWMNWGLCLMSSLLIDKTMLAQAPLHCFSGTKDFRVVMPENWARKFNSHTGLGLYVGYSHPKTLS